MIRKGTIAFVALALMLTATLGQAKDTSEQIRHEMALAPYNTIWDWVEAELQPDGTVVLRGAVVNPSLKSDLEARVRGVESVKKVKDDIRVLPISRYDNEIRMRVYRALFNSNSTLFPYAMGANPSIHIIVDNGKVTLKGVVSSAMDKQLAGMAANGVPAVFRVENELEVETTS